MKFSQIALIAFSALVAADGEKATIYSEKNQKGFSIDIAADGECQPLRLRELQRRVLSIKIPNHKDRVSLETVFCEGYSDLNCKNNIWEFSSSQDVIQNSTAVAVQCQTIS